MPNSIEIACFVLGAILLLISLLGGNFKVFGAEIASTISNSSIRFLCFLLALFFIGITLFPFNTKKSESSYIPSDSTIIGNIIKPTPTPIDIHKPLTPNNGECKITTNFGATLLVEPKIGAQNMTDLPEDEVFSVIQKKKDYRSYFYKIRYKNVEGWVHGMFVNADPNCFQ